MNIYICGLTGYAEAARLLESHREMCETRLPRFFIRQFEKLQTLHTEASKALKQLQRIAKAETESDSGEETNLSEITCKDKELLIIPLGEGGICQGLWRLGEECRSGIYADILKIPIPQEAVEIMEVLGADPYESDCTGSFLLGTPEHIPSETENLAELISEISEPDEITEAAQCLSKVPISYIGHTTKAKARILKMPEGERFLTPLERQKKDLAVKQSARK